MSFMELRYKVDVILGRRKRKEKHATAKHYHLSTDVNLSRRQRHYRRSFFSLLLCTDVFLTTKLLCLMSNKRLPLNY